MTRTRENLPGLGTQLPSAIYKTCAPLSQPHAVCSLKNNCTPLTMQPRRSRTVLKTSRQIYKSNYIHIIVPLYIQCS